MLIELNYVVFSFLLAVYSARSFFKRREKHLLYVTLSFTFLAFSATVQMLNSLIGGYGTQPIVILRLLKLGGIALYACFAISAIIALKEYSQVPLTHD